MGARGRRQGGEAAAERGPKAMPRLLALWAVASPAG